MGASQTAEPDNSNLSSLHRVAFGVIICSGCLWWLSANLGRRKGLRFPPGPKPRLITGNLNQLPRISPWLTFTSWSKIYGPIIYLRVFQTRTIILNTGKIALDLLESRSAIYSDRYQAGMLGQVSGLRLPVFRIPFLDPRFKIYRRMLHTGLNPRASKSYRPIQTQETQVFLQGLACSPKEFDLHIRRNAVAVMLKVAYGYQVNGNDDELVQLIEDGLKIIAELSVPGKFWVEFFPILRFVPEWFPGAGFKRLARESGKELNKIDEIPFEWARRQIVSF